MYFTRKEELHLANMIVGGAKYDKINEWHLTNFGKLKIRETKNSDGSEITLERREFDKFCLYSNAKAWMTSMLFQWEAERLSTYLKLKFPNTKFLLVVDNASAHKIPQSFTNLQIEFFPAGVTGILQPLDQCCFAVVKSQYRKWLAQHRLLVGEHVNEEMAVKQVTNIYNDMSIKTINHAWRSTGLSKFKSLTTENPEGISSEDIQNELNERLENALILSED